MVLLKAAGIWVLFVLVAILNGLGRETLLTPYLGEQVSHVISCFTGSLLFFLMSLGLVPFLGVSDTSQLWFVGGFWVILTVLFEFLFGHYVLGYPLSRLLADYNVLKGRLWIIVLLTVAFSPVISGKLRGIV